VCVSQLFPKELFVPFFVTLNNTKTLNKKMTAAGPILSLGNCDFTSSSSFDAREREREKTRHAQPSFSFELHFKNSESREANDTPLRERERERERGKKANPFSFPILSSFLSTANSREKREGSSSSSFTRSSSSFSDLVLSSRPRETFTNKQR